jgi:hypothetical protein
MNVSLGRFTAFGRRVSWLLLAKAMVFLVVLVYATNLSVTNTNYQAELGSLFKVANGLVAIDKGFSVAASGAVAVGNVCPSIPVLFALPPGSANTTIIAGHFVYAVQINDTSAPINNTYNVTLVLASGTYGPLCIRTALTAGNQVIVCRFDVGTALPASPYSFKVTVQ